MTTLLHLSPRHIGTHELSASIDRVTLYSFFSTLCLIPAIILIFSYGYTELVFPRISIPIKIIQVNQPKLPGNTSPKNKPFHAEKNMKGILGTPSNKEKNYDTIPPKDIAMIESISVPSDNGYGVSLLPLGEGGHDAQESGSLHSSPMEVSIPQEENEFEFIPDVEPIIDIAAIQKNVVYPQSAIRSGKEGTVVLKVRINEKGNAIQAEIVSSTSSVFHQAALNAVEHYSTNPAMNNGKAVPYTVYIPIKFRLR